MNSEFNDYKLNNPDGAGKNKYGEQKISFANDDSRKIKENPVEKQNEWDDSVSETVYDGAKTQGNTGDSDTNAKNTNNDNVSVSTVTSVISSVGGGGAIVGTVAASVATAVIVVAAFVSTLAINVSLVMASMYSLVFKVELSGAQEEDFATPIIAVLEDENGLYMEQPINPDSLYLTFSELEPAKEYVLTIKNEEKVFVKKSYFTATEQADKGFIEAYYEVGEVFIWVEMRDLRTDEYYTVRVYNDSDKIIFSKDATELTNEFRFPLSEQPQTLYFTLSVNGSVVAFYRMDKPEEDKVNVEWYWVKGYAAATATFTGENIDEPLTLEATIENSYLEPSCEIDGRYVYVATVSFNGIEYSDVMFVIDEQSALGHGFHSDDRPEFIWEKDVATGKWKATAVFRCFRDDTHTEKVEARVAYNGQIENENGGMDHVYIATVEFNGEMYDDEWRVEVDDFNSDNP